MVLDPIIGLAITLEPITIVAFIVILAAEKGTRKVLAFILGWLACLVAVVAVVVLVTRRFGPLVTHTARAAVPAPAGVVAGLLVITSGAQM